MDRQNKIQHLLITHLLDKGHITLTLPDGLVVEMGIVQENRQGELEKADDYSWVMATREDKTISMDSYNVGLRYVEDYGKMLFEDSTVDGNGNRVKILQAI